MTRTSNHWRFERVFGTAQYHDHVVIATARSVLTHDTELPSAFRAIPASSVSTTVEANLARAAIEDHPGLLARVQQHQGAAPGGLVTPNHPRDLR